MVRVIRYLELVDEEVTHSADDLLLVDESVYSNTVPCQVINLLFESIINMRDVLGLYNLSRLRHQKLLLDALMPFLVLSELTAATKGPVMLHLVELQASDRLTNFLLLQLIWCDDLGLIFLFLSHR